MTGRLSFLRPVLPQCSKYSLSMAHLQSFLWPSCTPLWSAVTTALRSEPAGPQQSLAAIRSVDHYRTITSTIHLPAEQSATKRYLQSQAVSLMPPGITWCYRQPA